MLAKTSCGWTLDLARLYVAALNSGESAYDVIEEVMPSASQVQIHISGVAYDDKADCYVESAAHPIPETMLELYGFVLEIAFEKVEAVFVRRSRNDFNRETVHNEVLTVREIAEGVGAIV